MGTAEALHHFDIESIFLVSNALMAFSRAIKKEVRKRQSGCCAYCGEKAERLEVHHVVPLIQGGPDTIDNAVGLCNTNGCHQHFDELALKNGIYFSDYEQGIHSEP